MLALSLPTQRMGFSHAIILIAFLSGCSNSSPQQTGRTTDSRDSKESPSAPNPAVTAPENTEKTEASTSPESLKTDIASADPAPAANTGARESVLTKVDDPRIDTNPPVHLEEALQRIDLRELPFMEGNTRASASINTYGFSAPVSETMNVAGVMSYVDKVLTGTNCVRETDASLEMQDETGAIWLYWHGDLMVTASCGISQRETDPQINAGIQIVGNFDLRRLPNPANATDIDRKPYSSRIQNSLAIEEVRDFYSDTLSKLGWIEYIDSLPGVKNPKERQLMSQRFLKNGMYISFFHYTNTQDQSAVPMLETSISPGILESEPIIPTNVTSVQFRPSHPLALAFETNLSLSELQKFYDDACLSRGYHRESQPFVDDEGFSVTYAHDEKPSLKVEAKNLGDTNIVVANEIK